MKQKTISIAYIIAGGFGLLILFIIVINYKTIVTLSKSNQINTRIVTVHSPSVDKLQELKIMVLNSKSYITSWIKDEREQNPDKQLLVDLIDAEYPKLRREINHLSKKWSEKEINQITKVFSDIDILFSNHEIVKSSLVNYETYTDPNIFFEIEAMIDEGGVILTDTRNVIEELNLLILEQRKNTQTDTQEILGSYSDLNFYVKKLGVFIVFAGIFIAALIIWRIVSPVIQVKNQLLLLGKGIIPDKKIKPRNDEIGEMARALNDLLDGFNRTSEFAKEVGAGNFKVDYKPLSDEDVLGHSLLRMKTDLFELTSDLEQKVVVRTAKIEEQKQEIETLLTHTTDSIRYAKRIQDAILPSESMRKSMLPNSFFLFLPKDIVSGDFYWLYQHEQKVFVGAIDCTGHGVPGAFMTIIGFNALSKVFQNRKGELNPSIVLNELNQEIIRTFDKKGEDSIRDGMDVSMCSVDYDQNMVEFAGAYNPLFYIRDNQLFEVDGNKFPVGAHLETTQLFENRVVPFKKGDVFYIFSDGYADQFGGPKGKKFRYSNFRELLLKIHVLPLEEQKRILLHEFHTWKGELEQVDDILVIGLQL